MPQLLYEWVTAQAQQRPEAVAVVHRSEQVTYGELEHRSNQLARVLREAGCQRGDRVCVLMPKSPPAIVAMLGIYKADCIYVPLDSSSPAARLAKIIGACDTKWILAAGPVSRLLDEAVHEGRSGPSVSIGWMERQARSRPTLTPAFTLDDLQRWSGEPLDSLNTRDDAAHILFTSGSTGTPKGVVITHANVIHFVEWGIEYFGMGPTDRISGHTPFHFDLSVFDLFGTFAVGAQLHLVPLELNVLPNALAEFIRTSELTQWFSVPSVLNYLAKFDAVHFNDFPALKRLLWCGEVLPTPSLMYWMQRLPHVRFTNLYGPTETTVASSYYTVPQCPADERAAIPIGTPCGGEELLVLDERLGPVPPGETGDLYIRGVGLSPGYWRDLDKTRAVFLPNPRHPDPSDRIYRTGDLAKIGDDKLVYFLGRADSQIKSRGYRIELGEIEAALNTLGCLQECAVVATNTEGFEGATICCAYVPSPGVAVTPVALRSALTKVLPVYMLPARWMAFDELPKNANGKIDRRNLREEFLSHEAHTHRQS